MRRLTLLTFATLIPTLAGCSGSSGNSTAAGGNGPVGGNSATGGSAAKTSGGANATGGSAAGTTTGGVPGTGGISGTSTSAATGGKTSNGTANTGGVPATGGVAPTGGTAASGGAATGGKSGTGTSSNTGGAGTGGKSATGGGTSNGGVVSTGGAATGGKSNTGGSNSVGGSSSTGGASTTGGTSGTDCSIIPDLGVRFVGRVDACDPKGVRMAWSGTGFVGKFKGTSVSVHLSDSANQYTVLIDGTLMPTLKTVSGDQTYPLASGLSDAEHTVELYRRTEASQGTTVVVGISAGTGQMLAPPAAHARRVEIIGDSITCGYGDEGVNPCSFTPDTENVYLAYGSILARDLGAEISTVAYSGKGIYYNYNGNTVEPMPTLYDRTIVTDSAHLWNFAWQADLVIINLGTNDYSTTNDPTTSQFVAAYQTFLQHIRGKYPAAYILCTIGPMLSGTDLTAVRTNVGTAIAGRASAGDTKIKYYEIKTANTNPGCDYHPSLATQAAMAAELEVEVKSDLGW